MKKNPDTLAELVMYIECANSTLRLLHNAIQNESSIIEILESLYSTSLFIDFITEEMENQLLRIDSEVLRKAAEVSQA